MKKLFIITIFLFTIVLNATEKQLILRFGDKVNYGVYPKSWTVS